MRYPLPMHFVWLAMASFTNRIFLKNTQKNIHNSISLKLN